MPWHPPCALSNLIVTNLSSCQRIDFSIFVSFFLLRPTAKLFAFLRSCVLLNTFATGFFTRCFSIWLCSFQSTFSGHHASRAGFRRGFFKSFAPSGSLSLTLRRSGFFRSLKTIQVQEEEQSFRPLCVSLRGFFASSAFSTFVLHTDFSVYRPGMNRRVSSLILSLERR